MDSGHNYACLISQEGDLYSWGNNTFQQLGLGKKFKNSKEISKPTKVPFFESNNLKVIQVSCSKGEKHCHTHAITENGDVFAWGDPYKGQLGTYTGDEVWTHEEKNLYSEPQIMD